MKYIYIHTYICIYIYIYVYPNVCRTYCLFLGATACPDVREDPGSKDSCELPLAAQGSTLVLLRARSGYIAAVVILWTGPRVETANA